MDNASDYGSEDSRFESWCARSFCKDIHAMLLSLPAWVSLARLSHTQIYTVVQVTDWAHPKVKENVSRAC